MPLSTDDIQTIRCITNFYRKLKSNYTVDEETITKLYLNGYTTIQKLLKIRPNDIKHLGVYKAKKICDDIIYSIKDAPVINILYASKILNIKKSDIKILVNKYYDILEKYRTFSLKTIETMIRSIKEYSDETVDSVIKNIETAVKFLGIIVTHITEYINRPPDTFMDLIVKNIHKNWTWWRISKNPNIIWEDVENNLNLPWEWSIISGNKIITPKIVEKNLDRPWKWSSFSDNPSIISNPKFIETYIEKDWDWETLSSYITEDILEKAQKLKLKIKLDWHNLGKNPNISWNIIKKNLKSIIKKKNDSEYIWRGISQNPNITWENIKENLNLPWDWYYISNNPNITWEIMRDNPEIPWNEDVMDMKNPNIRWEDITAESELPEGWANNFSDSVTWDIVEANPEADWNWKKLTENPNISINDIDANPRKPWFNRSIYKREDITLDYVRRHPPESLLSYVFVYSNPNAVNWETFLADTIPKTEYHWKGISLNPSITYEIIQKNINKPWSFGLISENMFLCDYRMEELREKIIKEKKFNFIKDELLVKTLNPRRVLWYEDIESDNPLYTMQQKDIDEIYDESIRSLREKFPI